MYMIFNNYNKGWSIGVISDNEQMPYHLKVMLSNVDVITVRLLTNWFINHDVKAVAYCVGSLAEKWRSHRFVKRFNKFMAAGDSLLTLEELYRTVAETENRKQLGLCKVE